MSDKSLDYYDYMMGLPEGDRSKYKKSLPKYMQEDLTEIDYTLRPDVMPTMSDSISTVDRLKIKNFSNPNDGVKYLKEKDKDKDNLYFIHEGEIFSRKKGSSEAYPADPGLRDNDEIGAAYAQDPFGTVGEVGMEALRDVGDVVTDFGQGALSVGGDVLGRLLALRTMNPLAIAGAGTAGSVAGNTLGEIGKDNMRLLINKMSGNQLGPQSWDTKRYPEAAAWGLLNIPGGVSAKTAQKAAAKLPDDMLKGKGVDETIRTAKHALYPELKAANAAARWGNSKLSGIPIESLANLRAFLDDVHTARKRGNKREVMAEKVHEMQGAVEQRLKGLEQGSYHRILKGIENAPNVDLNNTVKIIDDEIAMMSSKPTNNINRAQIAELRSFRDDYIKSLKRDVFGSADEITIRGQQDLPDDPAEYVFKGDVEDLTYQANPKLPEYFAPVKDIEDINKGKVDEFLDQAEYTYDPEFGDTISLPVGGDDISSAHVKIGEPTVSRTPIDLANVDSDTAYAVRRGLDDKSNWESKVSDIEGLARRGRANIAGQLDTPELREGLDQYSLLSAIREEAENLGMSRKGHNRADFQNMPRQKFAGVPSRQYDAQKFEDAMSKDFDFYGYPARKEEAKASMYDNLPVRDRTDEKAVTGMLGSHQKDVARILDDAQKKMMTLPDDVAPKSIEEMQRRLRTIEEFVTDSSGNYGGKDTAGVLESLMQGLPLGYVGYKIAERTGVDPLVPVIAGFGMGAAVKPFANKTSALHLLRAQRAFGNAAFNPKTAVGAAGTRNSIFVNEE